MSIKKFLLTLFIICISTGIINYSYGSFFITQTNDILKKEYMEVQNGESIVVSFPGKIEEINFSKDSGFTIRTLEGGVWKDMSNNIEDYNPLNGYLIKNLSPEILGIEIKYKNINLIEDTIFQKSLKAGWNLIGIAYKDDYNGLVKSDIALGEGLPYSQIIDFTKNDFIYSGENIIETDNFFNMDSNYQIKTKSEIKTIDLIENMAYGLFVNLDSVISGSQKTREQEEDDDILDDLLGDLDDEEVAVGSLNFAIVNDGVNQDEIEDVVLAGTNSVALAEIKIEADDENINIQELVLTATGDLTTTLADVRIMNGSSVIASEAIITLSGSNTIITFEDEFIIEESLGKINALLVADIEIITNQGGEISAEAGDISISLDSIVAKGVNSNTNIITTTAGTETSDEVTIVPALVTVSIDDELGIDDSDAVINFSVEKGNNYIENDNLYIYSMEFETAIDGSGITIRNDDNETLAVNKVGTYINFSEIYDIMASFKIIDGDKYELSVEGSNDQIRIDNITYWIDLNDNFIIDTNELFQITNNKIINLGTYDSDLCDLFEGIEACEPENDLGDLLGDLDDEEIVGSLNFAIVNDGVNQDEIENIVLAGTDSVAIAEIEIEADDENINIQELAFIANGDLTTTLDNVRIVLDSTVIASGAVITLSNGNTVITFEDDFIIEESLGKINALLVADIEIITNQGGEVSAESGNISISLDSIAAKGVNSNTNIITTTAGTETSDEITIVPALVTVYIDDELGTNDSDAVIDFSVNKGENNIENDDVVVYSIEIETAVVGSGITIRNDDNETLSLSGANTGTMIYLDLNTIENIEKAEIGNGYEYEFSVQSDSDEIRIVNYGITYWVDLDDDDVIDSDELFKITNDKVIDLGEYDAD